MVRRKKLKQLPKEIESAYNECLELAHNHYENFPVASKLLPRYLRRSVAAIYAFARTADDIADEGNFTREERLERMTNFESNLYDIQYGKPPTEAIFVALNHTIEKFNLPIQLFYDLLTAFRQDILKDRYQNFTEVKDYCHYSANPIGRLLLHLAGQATHENLILSDHICTGLQLINFIQDIEIDLFDKNRCYIPLDELQEFHLTLNDIKDKSRIHNYRALLNKQLMRAGQIYQEGSPLGANLPGFFGFEIRYIIACGQKVLDKLKKRKDLYHRPTVNKYDLLFLFIKTMITKPEATHNIDPILERL